MRPADQISQGRLVAHCGPSFGPRNGTAAWSYRDFGLNDRRNPLGGAFNLAGPHLASRARCASEVSSAGGWVRRRMCRATFRPSAAEDGDCASRPCSQTLGRVRTGDVGGLMRRHEIRQRGHEPRGPGLVGANERRVQRDQTLGFVPRRDPVREAVPLKAAHVAEADLASRHGARGEVLKFSVNHCPDPQSPKFLVGPARRALT